MGGGGGGGGWESRWVGEGACCCRDKLRTPSHVRSAAQVVDKLSSPMRNQARINTVDGKRKTTFGERQQQPIRSQTRAVTMLLDSSCTDTGSGHDHGNDGLLAVGGSTPETSQHSVCTGE